MLEKPDNGFNLVGQKWGGVEPKNFKDFHKSNPSSFAVQCEAMKPQFLRITTNSDGASASAMSSGVKVKENAGRRA